MKTVRLYGEYQGVDDLLERVCVRQGWLVTRGRNVLQELATLRVQPPALILLVADSKAEDDFAMLYELRSDVGLSTVPVMMIGTPGGPVRELQEAVALGASDFMDSPFHVDEFIARMRCLLSE